jgi:hypothetical protein
VNTDDNDQPIRKIEKFKRMQATTSRPECTKQLKLKSYERILPMDCTSPHRLTIRKQEGPSPSNEGNATPNFAKSVESIYFGMISSTLRKRAENVPVSESESNQVRSEQFIDKETIDHTVRLCVALDKTINNACES